MIPLFAHLSKRVYGNPLVDHAIKPSVETIRKQKVPTHTSRDFIAFHFTLASSTSPCQQRLCHASLAQVDDRRLVVVDRVIFTHDNVTVRIINLTTMLLTEQHQLSGCRTLDEYEVDVQHAEDDEDEHHEVVDDAH